MSAKAEDKRTRTTRDAIVGSFNEMALERGYGAIRVAELAEEAGVGRSTFYEQYRGKQDVLLDAATPILSALAGAAEDGCNPAALAWVFDHFWEHQQVARQMLGGETGEALLRRLAEMIETAARNRGVEARAARILAAQAAGAQFALIRAWLGGAVPGSSEEIAAALVRFTSGGTRAASPDGHAAPPGGQ